MNADMSEAAVIEDNGGPVRGHSEARVTVPHFVNPFTSPKPEITFDQALEVVKAEMKSRRTGNIIGLVLCLYQHMNEPEWGATNGNAGYEFGPDIDTAISRVPIIPSRTEQLESEIAAKSAELAKLKGGAK